MLDIAETHINRIRKMAEYLLLNGTPKTGVHETYQIKHLGVIYQLLLADVSSIFLGGCVMVGSNWSAELKFEKLEPTIMTDYTGREWRQYHDFENLHALPCMDACEILIHRSIRNPNTPDWSVPIHLQWTLWQILFAKCALTFHGSVLEFQRDIVTLEMMEDYNSVTLS